jgi:hypothetical protein
MDDFDLFDGLSLKVATPTHAEATAALATAPHASHHHHAHSNGHQQHTEPAAAAPGASGDDMFSGMSLGVTDAPAAAPVDDGSSGGGSLLSMLESGSTGDAGAGEPSGFSFVTESSAPADDAATDAAAGGGSSFSFLSSSEPAETVDEEPQPAAAATPGNRKASASDMFSPNSASTHSSQHNTPSAKAAVHDAFAGIPTETAGRHPSFSQSGPGIGLPSARKASNALPTFEEVHSELDSKLTWYWDNLKAISLTQSVQRTQQIALEASLKATQDQITALEVQQQAEIEAENYDGADQINSQLEALKAQLGNETAQLNRLTHSISEQERQKGSLRARTRDTLDECVKNLLQLSKQHTFQMTQQITSPRACSGCYLFLR